LEVYLAGNGKTLDELKEESRDDAKKSVLRDILFNEIARREKITVTDNDLNREIAIMANVYRTTPKQIAKALKDNGQIQTIVSNLRKSKAKQFIIENMADVKNDKPADDKVDAADDKSTDDKVKDVDEKKVEE